MITCKGGGKVEVRAGALMRILGALETKGGWCFQEKPVKGVDNRLADGITRWKGEEIQKNLAKESPQTVCQVQELGKEEQRMCSEILREDAPLDGLRLRLERLTRQIGGCG